MNELNNYDNWKLKCNEVSREVNLKLHINEAYFLYLEIHDRPKTPVTFHD